MASIRFNVKPAANNKMQIRAIFQDGKTQIPKNIGESIPANKLKEGYKYWDDAKQYVRGLESASRINAKIDNWRSSFGTYKDECSRDAKRVDIPLFIKSLEGTVIVIKNTSLSLVSTITSYIASIKVTHDRSTKSIFTVLKTQVEKYEKKCRTKIFLADCNRTFYKDFCKYLIEKENNHNSTLHKKQKNIITVINYALEDLKVKLPDLEYQKKYKFKQVKAPKFPLYPEELATLKAHAPADPYHQVVLDAFLLACETGLRYSDIAQLQNAHIKTHIADGSIIRYIDLTNIKGASANDMPLSEAGEKIINKYMDAPGPFFKFSYSQSVSRTLKIILEGAELTRPCEVVKAQGAKVLREIKPLHDAISFHMARNTYITRLLSLGVAPSFVQENAGHSDLKITMAYNRDNAVQRWQATLNALNTKN